jgi:hypothetical protein
MASHLTALLPPAPGVVRLRARAVVAKETVAVCLFPCLYAPPLDENDLSEGALQVVDRLVIDVDVATGEICNPGIPWPELAGLQPAAGHLGHGAGLGEVAAVVSATSGPMPPPTRAAVVSALARDALGGNPDDILSAAHRLADGARLMSIPLGAPLTSAFA